MIFIMPESEAVITGLDPRLSGSGFQFHWRAN